MLLRKFLFIVFSVTAVFSSVSAYDTQGKFGMGVRVWGTPLLLFSNMKIGLTNYLGIEPSAGFHQLKLSYTPTTEEVWDPVLNDYIVPESKEEVKYNVLMFSNIFDIKPILREKSNFVIRLGAGYYRAKASEEFDGSDFEESLWNFSIKWGFGVEHFFNDHFSVYSGFLNAWGLFGSSNADGDPAKILSLGNQFAELSFVWYMQ